MKSKNSGEMCSAASRRHIFFKQKIITVQYLHSLYTTRHYRLLFILEVQDAGSSLPAHILYKDVENSIDSHRQVLHVQPMLSNQFWR